VRHKFVGQSIQALKPQHRSNTWINSRCTS